MKAKSIEKKENRERKNKKRRIEIEVGIEREFTVESGKEEAEYAQTTAT